MIDWNGLTWEGFGALAGAIATIIAAVVAVVGAIKLGGKQLAIQRNQTTIALKQTQILERQTKLAEIDQRIELFDRRFSIYQAANGYLAHIVTHSAPPSRDMEIAFGVAIGQSRFLFPKKVTDDLEAIYKRTLKFSVLHREMQRLYERHGHYGDGNPDKEAVEMTWIVDTYMALIDVFGDELKLTHADVESVR